MNVNDFNFTEHLANIPCKMKAIFEKQRELMLAYHIIEERNGLLQTPDYPVNLNDRHGQARLKDFSWRITEELGEATDALLLHPNDLTHYQEELVDALHFYVELILISGITYDQVRSSYPGEKTDILDYFSRNFPAAKTPDYEVACRKNYMVIQFLSNAMNCLKNKPWKVTHLLTDKNRYILNILTGFRNLMAILFYAGLSPDDVYVLYCLKNQVNQFRQRSKY